MRQAEQTQLVAFRAGDRMVSAVQEQARQSGITVSEYLRTIIREKVGLPKNDPAEVIPLPLHTRAAGGDGDAFAQLADAHYQSARDGYEPMIVGLGRAAVYARLAAMSRGTRDDWLSFIYLLDKHAQALRTAGFDEEADKALGEAVALAEFMADDGDEEVSRMVVASAEGLTPNILDIARGLRETVKDAL